MRHKPMRYTLIKYTPRRGMLMRYTPARCTPVRYCRPGNSPNPFKEFTLLGVGPIRIHDPR